MEYSTLIGKSVLSPSGASCGYVIAAYLREDLTSLACLSCANEEEETYYLPAHAVKLVGDAVVAGKARLKAPAGVPCPVGKTVFDEYGGFLGRARALTDGAKGVLTVAGILGDREFPAAQISSDENVIVSYAVTPKVKHKRSTRLARPASAAVPSPAVSSPAVPSPAVSSPAASPVEATSDSSRTDLLGKSVKREVEGLCAEGETVTIDMIRRARENNRLLELTANVLTE